MMPEGLSLQNFHTPNLALEGRFNSLCAFKKQKHATPKTNIFSAAPCQSCHLATPVAVDSTMLTVIQLLVTHTSPLKPYLYMGPLARIGSSDMTDLH